MTANTGLEARRQLRQRRFRELPIDGQSLKRLAEAGMTWLRTNQATVNALNVFPVPDGDTGTNMLLTMQSAFDEIADSPERNIGAMAHLIAQGALMGARGNSGVILSQLWRGLARGLDGQTTLDGPGLVRAFAEARDTAYRGVVRPVEGTILTVAKDVVTAVEAALLKTDHPVDLLEIAVEAAEVSVNRTPELLKVLRDAGVVDAGGMGLFFILEGMVRYIHGHPLDAAITTVRSLPNLDLEHAEEMIEPGQDYEIVVDFRPKHPLNLERFYKDLETMGTSIQVGEGEGLYRLHIHVPTEKRYEPIDYAMSLGTITKVAIENLIAQMDALRQEPVASKLTLADVEPGQIAAIAVAPGPGIARVFASLGAAAIVQGGQTMNPSTKEILEAFENLPTDKIVILPNNKNILMAARQVAELTVKQVAVIPSRTVPQGLVAMLNLQPDGDFAAVTKRMAAAVEEVITGEITSAVRTTEVDGVHCGEGDFIAMLETSQERKMVLATQDLEAAVLGLLEYASAQEHELITLFFGEALSSQTVNQIADRIREVFPEQEVEIQDGGQPYYHFIIAIE